MESVRSKQVEELIKRHFSVVLQQNGSYVYGSDVFVTVTKVMITPDYSLAKIYLSIFNTENKQEVLLVMDENRIPLKQMLVHRIRKHVRRMPEIAFYEDDTIDEMYRLHGLFQKLHQDNQMGDHRESEEE